MQSSLTESSRTQKEPGCVGICRNGASSCRLGLVCFDSTYSSVFGLPMTIQRSHYANVSPSRLHRLINQCLSWAQEHLHLRHDQDTALAFVHETGPIVRTRELLRGSDSISTDLKVSLNEDLAVRARSIRIKWFEAPGKRDISVKLTRSQIRGFRL